MINAIVRARGGAVLLTSAVAVATVLPQAASATTCNSSKPCIVYQNSNSTGIQGVSSKATGVLGQTRNTSGTKAGVQGNDLSTDDGINDGVLGTVTNGGWGVAGTSGTSAFGGVFGSGTTGVGVEGTSNSSYGGSFSSTNGTGLTARSSSGYGADISGSNIGLVARSDQYPLLLGNSRGDTVFFVGGSGDVYVNGGYHTLARTRSGQTVTAFSSSTTTPNVEDVGSAQLINGTASVRLDPALAASIDFQSAYHVFLTPSGDTRGLFVASKTPTGFVVRETQGGRGNIAFDYRIVGTALGQTHRRMTLTNAAAIDVPRAKLPASIGKKPQQ